jgi:hypothetical protein
MPTHFRRWILYGDRGEFVVVPSIDLKGHAVPKGLEPVAAPTSLVSLLSAGRPQVQTLMDIYIQVLGGTMLHAPSTNEIQIMISRIEAALQSGRLLLYRRRTMTGA